LGDCLLLGNFMKITLVAHILGLRYPQLGLWDKFDKNWVGLHFRRFFSQTHLVTLVDWVMMMKLDREAYDELLLWFRARQVAVLATTIFCRSRNCRITKCRNQNCRKFSCVKVHITCLINCLMLHWLYLNTWSQSYDHELQHQRCKNLQRRQQHSAFAE
jgi:hypothetical protein